MSSGDRRRTLEEFISPVHDFCPALKLVLITRQSSGEIEPGKEVELRPLEAAEIASYLRHHPQTQPGLERHELLKRIQTWSDGLPMRLDKFLEDLKAFSASEILDEDAENPLEQLALSEPVPRALSDAVAALAGATEGYAVRSFKLLKVLTVLRDGETYQSIKRFYDKEPFHPNNVTQLIRLALLEAVPISQTQLSYPFIVDALYLRAARQRSYSEFRDKSETM